MKNSWQYKLRVLILPGLKRWILFILLGIFTIVLGVLLLLEEHPVRSMLNFMNDIFADTARVLPHKISGIIALSIGGILTSLAVGKLVLSILGAYMPEERESIPDVLYRRRHLARGPRVVVIGGGTGLSNLLKGLKTFTNNITAIVTVGDDGGSSGRLREELGVLPPGDMRNCITALADEEKLVTELFRYRFQQGSGLEGHSFGNLFLSAVCAITNGDMLEAARAASRVLNSCGQVLPSTLQGMSLIAELENGQIIKGESQIPNNDSRIVTLKSSPETPAATPAALEAILQADFIVIGPGSLYTSIIPNLLVKGIPEAIMKSRARKVYVCNVMTQKGETTGYSVADHVKAILTHAGFPAGSQANAKHRFMDRVLINLIPGMEMSNRPLNSVDFDPEKLKALGVRPMLREIGS
ncbi:MAG: YvcK family protein, partial [Candidatus Obscuribacterales bacterium]|nr:YvcK family protein [Candidatus Obscuribacterales bacterium]